MNTEVTTLLEKNFDLKHLAKEYDIDDLVAEIASQIKVWLNRDLEKLLQVCYRIDLGEDRLKYFLSESPPETMAEEIAKALIQRHFEKVELRQRFSPNKE